MILPLAKLGTLALRTFSKPIANRFKKEASIHPKFRQFIINFAQANHRFTTNMQRRIYGHSTNVAIRPLNEEKAVQAAADLVGELFVFSELANLEQLQGIIWIGHGDLGWKSLTWLVLGAFSRVQRLGSIRNPRWNTHNYSIGEGTEITHAWVAVAAVIFEVQRSARSEARKEEQRRQELEAMKQRDEDLAREIELLKQKLAELEELSKGRGLSGLFHIRHPHHTDNEKAKST
ncbi:hypothetical protein Patl1_02368 [Pistacia atlantica]|uniref:Uncharacterized protein n=1 Tax=Pistacia atlantica TaxID=434234 RepID=A0ACC1C5N1_9ROSI|nr:hypothetical protein Patl1_02368 [Pistacia atlantica]